MFNVRQMPLCQATTVGVVDALSRYGEDALIGEEELLHRTIGGCMGTIGSIALELRAIQGGYASLVKYKLPCMRTRLGERIHLVVARPQELLRGVEGESRDRRRRVVRSWRG
jgi:hypothetical protein